MPTSRRTGRPVSSDTSAVVMVMPADGPSLGTAPAGKCTWKRRASVVGVDVRRSSRWLRTHDRAIWADSFITSPSWPVTWRPGSPSHGRGLDEEHVAAGAGDGQAGGHARAPTVRSASSSAWNRGPAQQVREVVPSSTTTGVAAPPATLTATLRSALPSWRSSSRTPASRV